MVTVGYNPSTGKALMGTGGALCIGCCGGGTIPCQTEPRPATLTVSFSSVDSCSGYEVWGGTHTVNKVVSDYQKQIGIYIIYVFTICISDQLGFYFVSVYDSSSEEDVFQWFDSSVIIPYTVSNQFPCGGTAEVTA